MPVSLVNAASAALGGGSAANATVIVTSVSLSDGALPPPPQAAVASSVTLSTAASVDARHLPVRRVVDLRMYASCDAEFQCSCAHEEMRELARWSQNVRPIGACGQRSRPYAQKCATFVAR